MMYKYMTLSDETEIVHSQVHEDGRVKVYIEKPIEGGFQAATCWLPDYRWENISGFSKDEIAQLDRFVHANAHLILQFAAEGGFANASSF